MHCSSSLRYDLMTAYDMKIGRRVFVNRDHEPGIGFYGYQEISDLSGLYADIDGPGGVETARGFRPEVLLLDLGLPGFDGYEVARVLRADPACADALFIAISGYAQDSDRQRSAEAGFEYHCAKPVDFTALLTAIRTRLFAGPE